VTKWLAPNSSSTGPLTRPLHVLPRIQTTLHRRRRAGNLNFLTGKPRLRSHLLFYPSIQPKIGVPSRPLWTESEGGLLLVTAPHCVTKNLLERFVAKANVLRAEVMTPSVLKRARMCEKSERRDHAFCFAELSHECGLPEVSPGSPLSGAML